MAGTPLSNAAATGRRETWLTLAILGGLLAASVVPSSAYRFRPGQDTPAKKVFRSMQKRGLNREALARQTAGYYEGLLDEAANVTQMGGRGLLDWRFWLVERKERSQREARQLQNRSDFLRFELRPNVDVPDLDERRRVVTNSLGMMDREYPRTPAPGTSRIVLIGDSVSQGIGAEFGRSYEARVEEALNATAGDSGPRVEVLNLSVRGYQLTQLVEVALERAPALDPDLYVLALTERSVFSSWADHLAGLVRSRVDLKYDFLRQLVDEAGITPAMTAEVINARLAPHKARLMQWAFDEMARSAARSGARFVVLLVPTADDPEVQIEQFDSTKALLAEMAIPTIDLLDTFAYIDDISTVRVSAGDKHPDTKGHELLSEALLARLGADRQMDSWFRGSSESTRVDIKP